MGARILQRWLVLGLAVSLSMATAAAGQGVWPRNMPEQQRIPLRNPASLRRVAVDASGVPETVTNPLELPSLNISLDEAIRLAIENARVVRVLAGVTAVSSGSTVYDPAVIATSIDTQRARFDPRLFAGDTYSHNENGVPILDPMAPGGVRIAENQLDGNNAFVGANKTTVFGSQMEMAYNSNGARSNPGVGLLNPVLDESLQLRYDQPLLRNSGRAVNLAPIVLARIDTQSSYFRLKDSVQELVRGVVEAYWQLVVARVDMWARERQVEQGQAAFERAEARRGPLSSAAEVAQTRLALANFRNNLIASRASVLQREAALRNILGLPPDGNQRFVPVTPPARERAEFNWNALVALAEQQRPDIVELKLILEADQQRLILAENDQWPDLNAFALYRWNGLTGEAPAAVVRSGSGQLTDWSLGINFEVPIGLRAGRAGVRRQELIIARDQANLQQGVHAMTHVLALNLRNLDQFYDQYLAIRDVRQAATDNLAQQAAEYATGRAIFLNVLQAITDWGNSVSSEAAALALYNVELANLERQTGTILESHGVRFFEERFGAIGPLGPRHPRCYPEQLRPGPNGDVYPAGDRPSEEYFDLQQPIRQRPTDADPYLRPPEELERPRPLPPIDGPGGDPGVGVPRGSLRQDA